MKQYDLFRYNELNGRRKCSGLLICIDFQKTFNNLEWNFLLRCLESFNFGSSLILFVIGAEILAISIRQNSMIKGITIERNETKLLQYTTAVLSDISSALTLFRLPDDFEKI